MEGVAHWRRLLGGRGVQLDRRQQASSTGRTVWSRVLVGIAKEGFHWEAILWIVGPVLSSAAPYK